MKRNKWIITTILLIIVMLTACGTKNTEKQESVKTKTQEETKENTEEKKTTEEYVAGTSQDDATLIPEGKKITGKLKSYEEGWYSFKTGNDAGTSYSISFLVSTMQGKLWCNLYDESGTKIEYKPSFDDGKAETITLDNLEKNKTYCFSLGSATNATIGYTFIVRNSNEDVTVVNQNISESKGKLQDEDIIPGSNQYDATLIPLGTKVYRELEKNNHNAWFAFTTGDEVGDIYNITIINRSNDVRSVFCSLVDEYGEVLDSENSSDDGKASTIAADQLDINTTYYVGVTTDEASTTEYSLFVKDSNRENTAYRTVGNVPEARGASNMDEIYAGSNQDDPAWIPFETEVTGTMKQEEGKAWFAFTTGEDADTTYKINLENHTQDSYAVYAILRDEFGESIGKNIVCSGGKTATTDFTKLKPNTPYFIQLLSKENFKEDEKVEYSISIETSEDKSALSMNAKKTFEVPFEINETQIQFVANEATFIDEATAKEVLKPVAEAILANPDNAVLISGTTATYGNQKSCVKLSNRRAEAVKNLLVNTYKVPDSQLQTVGLGYEADPFERGADVNSNGDFVESEGKKNRRVIILDVDDPIAQEILR